MLTRENLPEKVTGHLRERILLGDLPAGYHLNEVRLAERLAVSRGSIRSGIRLLENEGLVRTPGNGRSIVVGLSQKDLGDLFEIRWTLESKAIETILRRDSGNDFSRLDALLNEMWAERNLPAFVELDIEFHYRLVEASQNRLLTQLWSVTRDLVRALSEISSDSYGNLDQVTRAHGDLLSAMKEGRTEGAIEALREHLGTGKALISEHLSKLVGDREG